MTHFAVLDPLLGAASVRAAMLQAIIASGWLWQGGKTMTQRQSGDSTRLFSSSLRRSLPALLGVALLVAATALAARLEQKPVADESHAAMTNAMSRMMAAMDIEPSGDVDKDFVAMMVPHHQGAIDMAQAELRHGHNELLRRIAQEIIVTQQQEIAAMRLALGQSLSASRSASNQQPSIAPAPLDVSPMSRDTSTRWESLP